jgi:hypothetical protein
MPVSAGPLSADRPGTDPDGAAWLALARSITRETSRELIRAGTLAATLDELLAGDNWLHACVAAINTAPEWLTEQAGDPSALVPLLVEDAGIQAGSVVRAQAAAAAAVLAWRREDADGAMMLARRAANWWSAVDRVPYQPPAAGVRPLATFADSLTAERSRHDVRVWAPVEDMILSADARPGSVSPDAGRRIGRTVQVRTWGRTAAGHGPLTLVLDVVKDGQPGLWRSPGAGLTIADDAFLAAAAAAWHWAVADGGLASDASVRWRLLDAGATRAGRASGDGAGLAFAVALHQAGVSRPWLHKLDPATGYLGAVSRDGAVAAPAVEPPAPPRDKHLRFLVGAAGPVADGQGREEGRRGKNAPPAAPEVWPAGTVTRAAALGHRPVRVRRTWRLTAACALALAGIVSGVLSVSSGQSDAASGALESSSNRHAQALVLANQALTLTAAAADPPRAIVAAAAAYALDPADRTAQDAVLAAAGSDPRALHYLDPAAPVRQLAMSSDGSIVAALLASGKIEAWHLAGATVRPLPVSQPPGTVAAIGFTGPGTSLVAAGSQVTVLDPAAGTSRQLGSAGEDVTALSASPESPEVVTSSPAGIRAWNAVTGASHLLSTVPAGGLSLRPDGQYVLAAGAPARLRLLSLRTGQVIATAHLPAAATSVLLAPSGHCYAVTAVGQNGNGTLYGFNPGLGRAAGHVSVPLDSTLELRPGDTAQELTPGGLQPVPPDPTIMLTVANAAVEVLDAPGDLTDMSGDLNATSMPIEGIGGAILASDGTGTTFATVLADGEVRVSTLELTQWPQLQVPDVAAIAPVSSSAIAVVTGMMDVEASVSLLSRTTGKVLAQSGFTRASSPPPAITSHYIAAAGNPTSALDLWQISGDHIVTLATNMATSLPGIRGLAIDEQAGLAFDAGGTEIQARSLRQAGRQVSARTLAGAVNCLTLGQSHSVLYACTAGGIMAMKVSADGTLGAPTLTSPLNATSLILGPGGAALIGTGEDAELLPHGLSDGSGAISLDPGQFDISGTALTADEAIVSDQTTGLHSYDAGSGTGLDALTTGAYSWPSMLWTEGDGVIGGATFDGSLFTLPPTRPAAAAQFACALLADPGAEWRADFGANPAIGALLPASGGCASSPGSATPAPALVYPTPQAPTRSASSQSEPPAAITGPRPALPASASAWSSTSGHFLGVQSMSCASSSLCVGVRSSQVTVYNGASWSQPRTIDLDGNVTSVSCPDASFCVAVDGSGNVLTRNGPSWSKPTSIDTKNVGAGGEPAVYVSCPAADFCAAVDSAGNAMTYNGSTWSAPAPSGIGPADEGNVVGVSCTSPTFCMTVDNSGRYATYDGTTWTKGVIGKELLAAVSCASAAFCMALDAQGNGYLFDGSSWKTLAVFSAGDAPSSQPAEFEEPALDCYAVGHCLAVSFGGYASQYTGSAWTIPRLMAAGVSPLLSGTTAAVSCEGASFCAASVPGYLLLARS